MGASRRPWNKGKTVGRKAPLGADALDLIRRTLKAEQNWRDLAILEVAVSTMLRGSDLRRLAVHDVRAADGAVHDRLSIRQKKTDKGLAVLLSNRARDALVKLIEANGKVSTDYLFTPSTDQHGPPLTTMTLRRLAKRWAGIAHVDERTVSAHSLRRTKAAEIYRRTGNIAAVKHLLGHANIAATARYLGVEEEDALKLSEQIDM
jgi:integrase